VRAGSKLKRNRNHNHSILYKSERKSLGLGEEQFEGKDKSENRLSRSENRELSLLPTQGDRERGGERFGRYTCKNLNS